MLVIIQYLLKLLTFVLKKNELLMNYELLKSRPEVIKLFSCSTQRSMKFHFFINIEIVKIIGNFMSRSQMLAFKHLCAG